MNSRLATLVFLALASGCAPRASEPPVAATPAPAPVAPATPSLEPPPRGLSRGEATIARIPWAGEGAGALFDVAPIGPGEALAVGESGVVHVRGDVVEVAPFPGGIATSVWADGASFAVAVGSSGLSYVREGAGAWTPVETGTDADLLAVWGRSQGGVREVYAGGEKGTLLRLNGSTWETLASPEPAHLSGITGNAAFVWALGEVGGRLPAGTSSGGGVPGEGVLLRSEDGAFTDACPELACGGPIYDGWAPVPNELWTVGARGEVVRYVGAQAEWIATGTRVDLTGIWGTGVRDLFVVGKAGTCLHFDGTGWKTLDAGKNDLRAIAGLPTGEAWMVGADGSIRHVPPPG